MLNILDNDVKTKTNKEKLDNFWYYNKNYVIALIIIIIAGISYYFYAIYEPDNDGTITILTQPSFYDVSNYIGETWSEFAYDLNNDGQVHIKVIPIQSDPNGDYGVNSTLQELTVLSITTHVNIKENFLFMLDEINYELLIEMGVQFTDLSQYSDNLKFNNELYPLKDTILTQKLGYTIMDGLYLALIDSDSSNTFYDFDLNLLQSLIKAE